MKIKHIILIFAALVLSCCAITPVRSEVGYVEVHTLENRTFEEVWDACREVMKGEGYQLIESDRKQGYMRAAIQEVVIGVEELNPKLTVLITEEKGKLNLACKVTTASGVKDPHGKKKEEMQRFIETLSRYLKN